MLGKTALKVLAGKQDTVEFEQLLNALKELGVDVEDILPDPEEPEDPEVPEDPDPFIMPDNPSSNKLAVTFDPPMCDWTNNPYDVYARVSGVYNREDSVSVYLVNCWNHCADVYCPGRYCGGHDGHWEDHYDQNTGQKTGSS